MPFNALLEPRIACGLPAVTQCLFLNSLTTAVHVDLCIPIAPFYTILEVSHIFSRGIFFFCKCTYSKVHFLLYSSMSLNNAEVVGLPSQSR